MRLDYHKMVRRRLTAYEKAQIHIGFNVGKDPVELAAELGCSERIVRKYYQKHRGYPLPQSIGRPPEPKPEPVKKTLPDRFYHSDFVPR